MKNITHKDVWYIIADTNVITEKSTIEQLHACSEGTTYSNEREALKEFYMLKQFDVLKDPEKEFAVNKVTQTNEVMKIT